MKGLDLFAAFKERQPWAAVVVTLLLGGVVAGLYLGRGRVALTYLIVEVLVYVFTSLAVIEFALQTNVITAGAIATKLSGILISIHIYVIARSKKPGDHITWYSKWYAILFFVCALPVLLALLLKTYFFETFYSAVSSMAPGIQSGDQFFVSKTSYGYSKLTPVIGVFLDKRRFLGSIPERGDVIVFKKPTQMNITFIRRVVGLPGETIQIIEGRLHIDGLPVEREIELADSESSRPIKTFNETLPNGVSYLVLDQIDDSRQDFTSAYTVPEGHLFVLSDNRDNSNGGRFSDIDFVPIENVTGKVVWVYWRQREQKIEF